MEIIQKEINYELDAYETVSRFCEAVKLSDGKDFTKAFTLCQLTWKTKTISPHFVFGQLKTFLVGKIHIKQIRAISEMCWIYQVKTIAGKYSVKVIKEKAPYKPSIHGVWGINPLSFREIEN